VTLLLLAISGAGTRLVKQAVADIS